MALVTINGVAVLSGTIYEPLVGVWTADLVIDQPDGTGFDAGTQVAIDSDNGFSLTGVVAPSRTGDFLDAVHVRVLGGGGGMAKQVGARSYAQPGALVNDVLQGLCADAGETLSDTVDETFINTNLIAWAVLAAPASHALETLLGIAEPTFNWRILTDGTLWMGVETWPTANPQFNILEQNPAEATFDLGVDSPEIRPGTTLDGVGQVARVEHSITSSAIRSRVWTSVDGIERGFNSAVLSIASKLTAPIDYFALYSGVVKSQSSDLLTVDFVPNDPRIAEMGGVQLRHGLPGVKVQINPTANILFGWDGGNPSLPYAALWGGGESVQSIQLAGTTPAARKGDNVNLGDCHVVLGAGSVTSVFINGIALPVGSDAPTPPDRGTISSGSSIVELG